MSDDATATAGLSPQLRAVRGVAFVASIVTLALTAAALHFEQLYFLGESGGLQQLMRRVAVCLALATPPGLFQLASAVALRKVVAPVVLVMLIAPLLLWSVGLSGLLVMHARRGQLAESDASAGQLNGASPRAASALPVDVVTVEAERMAQALSSSGYRADFSAASLWQVERFIEEQTKDGVALPDSLLSTHVGAKLFGLGAYTGEVLRRQLGGAWFVDGPDPASEIDLALRLGDGSICWPIQRVMKRFKNGPEDGIVGYGVAMGLDVGKQTRSTKSRMGR